MARARSKTVKYTAGEIGRVRVIEDFLPAPDALVPIMPRVRSHLPVRSAGLFIRHCIRAPPLTVCSRR